MTSAQQPTLRVENLIKRFVRRDGSELRAINDSTFKVWPGEFVVLLGPSGCGKTTLLRCLAGLERPDSGSIEIDGNTVYSSERRVFVEAEDRGISMVFQTYALWPHMSVADNVAYPLRYGMTRRPSSAEVESRVRNILALVGIAELHAQYPHQISGGQQQRVALARALVSGSSLVLFDEPLSNVDAKVREQLRAELVQMQHEIGFTAVYVTHDQEEAFQLADRIAVIERGTIEQFASPEEIYERPATRAIGNFVGKLNQVSGRVTSATGGNIEVDGEIGPVQGNGVLDGIVSGTAVVAAWRPEQGVLKLSSSIPESANTWAGVILETRFSGPYTETVIGIGDIRLRHWSLARTAPPVGEPVHLSVDPGAIRIYAAE
jgi:iron(III) transport system ATP-binding protein